MMPADDRMGALRLINPGILSAERLRSPIPFGELSIWPNPLPPD
jgi:hypothetical protein